MKVYICGPISLGGTLSEKEIRANLRRFQEASLKLRQMGHEVFDPSYHQPDGDFQASTSVEVWCAYMRLDIKALVDCNAIYKLSGWQQSPGAQLEATIADKLHLLDLTPEDGE